MSLFKVGEIAIVTKSILPEFPIGCEVEILQVVNPPPWSGYQYIVHLDPVNCRVVWACDECLRKKRPPPADGVGSWDEIEKLTGWNPYKEKITVIGIDEFESLSPLEQFRKFFTLPVP